MTILILIVTVFFGGPDDDTYSVVLSFKEMHCKACEENLTDALKKVAGVKSVDVESASASITIEEKTKFDYAKLKASCPRDLKLVAIVIEVRGVVSESNGKYSLMCKGSNAPFTMVNPDKKDPLAALKKDMGDDNKFQIKGVAKDATTLILESHTKVKWK